MKPRRATKLSSGAEVAPASGAGETALAWALGAGKATDLEQRVAVAVRRARTRRRRAAAAVAVTCCAVFAAIVGLQYSRENLAASPLAATARSNPPVISLPARQVLPDGSVVELNAGAEIDVQFSVDARRVVLRRGEAHFDVQKDPARAFVVAARGVEVRAVGTAFAVQLGSSAVEVVVTEGTVAVDKARAPAVPAAPEATPAPLATVAAGSRVVVELAATSPVAPAITVVTAADLAARLAWRVPRVEFSGTPLAEVIPIFNRHSRETLVLDPALGALQMSGVLRADNTDALLQLLKNEFAIQAEPRASGEIWLRK